LAAWVRLHRLGAAPSFPSLLFALWLGMPHPQKRPWSRRFARAATAVSRRHRRPPSSARPHLLTVPVMRPIAMATVVAVLEPSASPHLRASSTLRLVRRALRAHAERGHVLAARARNAVSPPSPPGGGSPAGALRWKRKEG